MDLEEFYVFTQKYLLRQYAWKLNSEKRVIVFKSEEKELLLNSEIFSDVYIHADGTTTVLDYLENFLEKAEEQNKDVDVLVLADILKSNLDEMVKEGLIRLEDCEFFLPHTLLYARK